MASSPATTAHKAPKGYKMAFWGLLALFVGAHWLLFTLMPDYADEFLYKRHMAGWFDGGEPLRWQMVADTLSERFAVDNCRLSNIVYVGLLLLPRYIAALVPAAGLWLMCVSLARFSRIGIRSLMLWVVALLLIVISLPWFENLLTLCYAVNYMVGAGLMASFMWLLVCDEGTLQRHRKALIAVPLLLGLWHEGFAVPALAGAVAFMKVTRQSRVLLKMRATMTSLLLPGIIIIAINALLINKAATYDYFPGGVAHTVLAVLKLQWPFALFCIFAAVFYKKLSNSGLLGVSALVITLSLTAMLLEVVFMHGERQSTPAHLASVMGLMWILGSVAWLRCPHIIVTSLLAAYLLMHLAAAVYVTSEFRRSMLDAHDTYMDNLDNPDYVTVFVKLRNPADKWWLLWRKPLTPHPPFTNAKANDYFAALNPRSGYRVIIPEQLLDATPTAGHIIPGDEEVRELGGWLFRPYSARDELTFSDDVEMQVGPLTRKIRSYHYTFYARDGKRYTFVDIDQSYFPTFLFPIKRLGKL